MAGIFGLQNHGGRVFFTVWHCIFSHAYVFLIGVEFLRSLESSPNTAETSGITDCSKIRIIFLAILFIFESVG